MDQDLSRTFAGFSKLNRTERLERLLEQGLLKPEDIQFLQNGGTVDIDIAEHFIENVIGFFQMPMGVATNFRIDAQDYMIPMAVEETSIIAAASKTAKWVRENGRIETRTIGNHVIGQVQIAKVKDANQVREKINGGRGELIELGNVVAAGLVRRGGGVQDIQVRILDRDDAGIEKMVVVHVYVDTCDAMGANIVNQVCEALKDPIERISGERVTMCILSNLVDSKLTEAHVVLDNIDPKTAEGIVEASLFSQRDPYRAATNNKGVLNGIDAVLIATGNDWRAVEAGMHAYSVKDGRYTSLTRWQLEDKSLVGTLIAPLIVGTVGGVTTLHPAARMNMAMMGIRSAEHLSRVCAAVGLVQNLGALRALSTVGVVEGHMKLHAANLAIAAGAKKEEIASVQRRLEELLKTQRRVSLTQAMEVLKRLRQKEVANLT